MQTNDPADRASRHSRSEAMLRLRRLTRGITTTTRKISAGIDAYSRIQHGQTVPPGHPSRSRATDRDTR